VKVVEDLLYAACRYSICSAVFIYKSGSQWDQHLAHMDAMGDYMVAYQDRYLIEDRLMEGFYDVCH
jgi:hypothetical protein